MQALWPFFNFCGLTKILVWISDHIRYEVLDVITFPFPNFNGVAVEIWKWISKFISHFTGHEITYPFWG